MAKRQKTAATNGRGRRPKNQDLPGLSDRAIKPLEDAAEAYADLRDQKQQLAADETDLKAKVLKLMHQHGKTSYHRGGITITVEELENVKVRGRRKGDDQDDAETGEDAPEGDAAEG